MIDAIFQVIFVNNYFLEVFLFNEYITITFFFKLVGKIYEGQTFKMRFIENL